MGSIVVNESLVPWIIEVVVAVGYLIFILSLTTNVSVYLVVLVHTDLIILRTALRTALRTSLRTPPHTILYTNNTTRYY